MSQTANKGESMGKEDIRQIWENAEQLLTELILSKKYNVDSEVLNTNDS